MARITLGQITQSVDGVGWTRHRKLDVAHLYAFGSLKGYVEHAQTRYVGDELGRIGLERIEWRQHQPHLVKPLKLFEIARQHKVSDMYGIERPAEHTYLHRDVNSLGCRRHCR